MRFQIILKLGWHAVHYVRVALSQVCCKGQEVCCVHTLHHVDRMSQSQPGFHFPQHRFPHGVRPVHGVRDPLKARLVLHGWFAEPSPFFTGPLAAEAAEAGLQDAMQLMFEGLAELPSATGVLTVRMVREGAGVESKASFRLLAV